MSSITSAARHLCYPIYADVRNIDDIIAQRSLRYDYLPEDSEGWTWDRARADSLGRAYNYPHQTTSYWAMYHALQDNDKLVASKEAVWYLDQAAKTILGMWSQARWYSQQVQCADIGRVYGWEKGGSFSSCSACYTQRYRHCLSLCGVQHSIFTLAKHYVVPLFSSFFFLLLRSHLVPVVMRTLCRD